MTTLAHLDEMIEAGVLRSIHAGKSAMAEMKGGVKRFCTIDLGRETETTGQGDTLTEAVDAALGDRKVVAVAAAPAAKDDLEDLL